MTFISYPDITAVSPGGQFRVEIRGEMADQEFFRDQSGFVYRLFATPSESEVWEWSPTEFDGLADYPHEVWVSDDGWVVTRLHEWFRAGLLVISPCGDRRMLRPLQCMGEGENGLLDDEPDTHIGSTSAGPNWESSSIALFHQYAGRAFWSILTWWGRRIVIDLEAGEVVTELPDAQKSLLSKLERSWILEQLHCAQNDIQTRDEPDVQWWKRIGWPVYAAAFHAGLLGFQEAAPLLRALQTSSVSGGSTSRSWIGVVLLPFRLLAKVSLLRLGIEPQWTANLILTRQRTGRRCAYAECPECREPHMVQEGLSQREMLQRVGVPEFLEEKWDYGFFDGERVITLRVHWHDRHKSLAECNHAEAAREVYQEYREAIDREPPVADCVERIDLPLWSVDPIHEYRIAHGF